MTENEPDQEDRTSRGDGSLQISCNDCEWSTTWGGGSAADDPAVSHAKETGHSVSTEART